MSVDHINLDCLQKAQRGDEESQSFLAQQAQARMHTFVYRMCLNHDLAEDLTQETLLALIKALPRLELTAESAFWSWLYRTALGKVQHHHRRQGAKRLEQRTMVNSEILETMSERRQTGPAGTLWRKEMVDLILDAMDALTLEYRTILTLRCLEDQSYAEIAVVLGGSQMRAKMLFYRAKTALRKQLARKGLSRSHFLGALTVFGAITSTSTRAATLPSVTAASAQATIGGVVLGTLLSKAVLIGVGILLAVTGAGILVDMTGTASIFTRQKTPAPPPWPGPGQPQYDNRLQLMGGPVYRLITDIVASHNPDQDGWRYVRGWLRPGDIQTIATPQKKPPRAPLVLEQDHWVEYGFAPARLRDRSGPEIGISIRLSSVLPTLYLTDGADRLQELHVTHYRVGAAPEILFMGFDLSDVPVDFEGRRIRLVGHDREGSVGGCAIFNVAASLTAQP